MTLCKKTPRIKRYLPSLCFPRWSTQKDCRPVLLLTQKFLRSCLQLLNESLRNLTITCTQRPLQSFFPTNPHFICCHFQSVFCNHWTEFLKPGEHILNFHDDFTCRLEHADGPNRPWFHKTFSSLLLHQLNVIWRNVKGNKYSKSYMYIKCLSSGTTKQKQNNRWKDFTKLAERKHSANSTKFVLFGPIHRPESAFGL